MNCYTLIALSRSCQAEGRRESKSAFKIEKSFQTSNFFLHRKGACLLTGRNAVDLYFSTLLWPSYPPPISSVRRQCVRTFFTVNQFVQFKRLFFLGISFIDETDFAVSKHHCCRRADLYWFLRTKKKIAAASRSRQKEKQRLKSTKIRQEYQSNLWSKLLLDHNLTRRLYRAHLIRSDQKSPTDWTSSFNVIPARNIQWQTSCLN